ncbi:hypothetical protein TOPH_02573, partial [Tolypocladium ophioglossoides CBS 100239]
TSQVARARAVLTRVKEHPSPSTRLEIPYGSSHHHRHRHRPSLRPPHGSSTRHQTPPVRSIALVLWCVSNLLLPYPRRARLDGGPRDQTRIAPVERASCPRLARPPRHSFNLDRPLAHALAHTVFHSYARTSWVPSQENRPAARRLDAHAQETSKPATRSP